MKYGTKIIVWHECYVIGGSDWSIIDILTNCPNKNYNFDFFVNKKHEGIQLLKRNLKKKSKFYFYSSIIEKLDDLKKIKIINYLFKIFLVRKLIAVTLLVSSFFNIHKKIKKNKSNFILINNGGYPGGLTSYLVIISAFLLKKKVVMIIRNFPPKSYKKNITMILTKFIIEKFDCKIISVSKSLKKSLIKDGGLQKENITVIYNGISIINKKKFANNNKIKIKKCSVGIFGRVEYRKGHHLLISAWKKIQKKEPKLTLYIVGNGDKNYIDKLKLKIKKNNLDGSKIIWINYTNNIYSILNAIDLVVVPSINFESFGRIAVEAMALKKPIITSNFGGLKEVNKNNKTGLVLNKELLSDKIIELMKNKNKRNLFGKTGYENYQKNYTSKIMTENYYNYIKNKIYN